MQTMISGKENGQVEHSSFLGLITMGGRMEEPWKRVKEICIYRQKAGQKFGVSPDDGQCVKKKEDTP